MWIFCRQLKVKQVDNYDAAALLLMKRLPLFDKELSTNDDYRVLHPYVVESREYFLQLHTGKQRALEVFVRVVLLPCTPYEVCFRSSAPKKLAVCSKRKGSKWKTRGTWFECLETTASHPSTNLVAVFPNPLRALKTVELGTLKRTLFTIGSDPNQMNRESLKRVLL